MTLNGKELRVPGWFIATATLLVAIVVATWRLSGTFNAVLLEHQQHSRMMDRLDRRVCRMEEGLRQLGAKITPDVECDRHITR